jgi:hypothetical protein
MEHGTTTRFTDRTDLILVDEEVRVALASKAQHGVVKILNPTTDGFAITQFDGNDHLAIAERAQVERFLAGFAGRRGFGTASGSQRWRHDVILDAKSWNLG